MQKKNRVLFPSKANIIIEANVINIKKCYKKKRFRADRFTGSCVNGFVIKD